MAATTRSLLGANISARSPAHIHKAIHALHDVDIVFRPATDGGYYLAGLRQLRPRRESRLFDTGIAWSTASVLNQSQAAAQRVGLRTVLIRDEHDIDTLGDLVRLRSRLSLGSDGHVAGARTSSLVRSLDIPARMPEPATQEEDHS